MKYLGAIGFLGLVLVWSHAEGGDKKETGKGDASKLVGTYQIVSETRAGKKIDDEHFAGVTVVIAKNAITTLTKDKKEVYAATYELDSSKKPWHILMTATITPAGEKGKDTKALGLIDVQGDTVKLIYALPGGEAPTDFKAGEKQQMFVLKRVEKK